jgi:hypothetical protein
MELENIELIFPDGTHRTEALPLTPKAGEIIQLSDTEFVKVIQVTYDTRPTTKRVGVVLDVERLTKDKPATKLNVRMYN